MIFFSRLAQHAQAFHASPDALPPPLKAISIEEHHWDPDDPSVDTERVLQAAPASTPAASDGLGDGVHGGEPDSAQAAAKAGGDGAGAASVDGTGRCCVLLLLLC